MNDTGNREFTSVPGSAVLMALVGVLVVFAAVARYGPGITTDSVTYLSAADSMRNGQGLLGPSGTPYTLFPPLLPVALAMLGVIGLGEVAAASVLNAVCFAIVILATARSAGRITGARSAALGTAVVVLVSAPTLDAFTYVWTEPLFLALFSMFALTFGKAITADDWPRLVGVALLAATLPMVRYIGVVLIPVGALLVLVMGAGSIGRRLQRAAVFGAVASLPLALYLLRNLALKAAVAGERFPSTRSLVSVLRSFVATALNFLVPWRWIEQLQPVSDAAWALLGLFGAVAAVIATLGWLLIRWWRLEVNATRDKVDVALLMLFIGAHSVFLCFLSWTVAFEPINTRYLVPTFPAAVILVGVGLHAAVYRSAVARRVTAGMQWAIVVVFVAFIALQGGRAVLLLSEKVTDGAGGYATSEWMESPLVGYLRANRPPPGAFTNGPDLVFLATGRRLAWAPMSAVPGDVEAFRARLSSDGSVDLFWFTGLEWRAYVLSLEQLSYIARLEVVHAEPDGAVYSVTPVQ